MKVNNLLKESSDESSYVLMCNSSLRIADWNPHNKVNSWDREVLSTSDFFFHRPKAAKVNATRV